ncbi:putative porin [Porphyromonas sp.]|uniref:putative porin n=1 Tax=Porphyromonas sp. TaxID=1924944 RepID=UPI0026DC8A24|nr:putative porin [Porphyromonas sp.]MDO4695779.1 putative porin [Porphyromonas sp.]MDO4771542.1 putative porin [Porphyromonas sp.]
MRNKLSLIRYILLIFSCILLGEVMLSAQIRDKIEEQFRKRDAIEKHDDSDNDRIGNLHATYIFRRTGDVKTAFLDTLKLNYFHRSSIEGLSVAEAYTSTYASPYQSKIYFDRPLDQWGDFYFTNPYDHLIHRGEDMRFFDAKVPYTSLAYIKNGGSDNVEENFHTLFSTNLGKKLNVGGQFDYDYANGYYASTKSKNVTYRAFLSYKGDRYQAYLSVGNTNTINLENGGITDDRYITNPDEFTDGRRSLLLKDIPTKYKGVWNRIHFGSVRLNHRFSLGITRTDSIKGGDSVRVVENFTPVTSFFHDFHYEKGRRRFVGQDQGLLKDFPEPILPRPIDATYYPNDTLVLVKISNTLGIELLEGFHKWAKFGLAAFVSLDHKRYRVPLYGVSDQNLDRIENTTYVGGRLSSKNLKNFGYHVQGEFAFMGSQVGELRIDGEAYTRMKLFGKDVFLDVHGNVFNTPPSYLLKRYKATLHEWDRDLVMTQRLRAGGRLRIPATATELHANFETIQNPLYVDEKAQPNQLKTNFRVLALGIDQKLSLGFLNWENSVVWQNSSDHVVAPLPDIAIYSNFYIKALIAKVMTLQLGVDAKYHTAYHAPYYDPTTQLFKPQSEISIGGDTPMMSIYANVHLKRTRFFVQYYNVSSRLFKPNYFSTVHYPQYPAIVRLGLVVDLRN